jgi:exodeoxyribonuclease VII large subunit
MIYPSQVQGELAAASLVNALKTANVHQRCDVLVVARGGGSLEDLWPFNEESVARAIYDSAIPVVSAVGHETDISISDLVADARAATPTAAAEMLSPDREQLSRHLVTLKSRLSRLVQQKIDVSNQRLDLAYTKITGARHELERQKSRYAVIEQSFIHLARSMIMGKLHDLSSLRSRLHTPDRILEDQRQSCLNLFSRMERIQAQKLSSALFSYKMLLQRFSYQQPGRQLQQKQESLALTSKRLLKIYPEQIHRQRLAFESRVHALNTLSPLMTLGRGYAALQDGDGEIISSVDQVHVGERINTMLRDGTLQCMIENISRKQDAK